MPSSNSDRLRQFILAGVRKTGEAPTPEVLVRWSGCSEDEAQEALAEYRAEQTRRTQEQETRSRLEKEKKIEAVLEEKKASFELSVRPILRWTNLAIAVACMVWSWGNVFAYFESSPWGALISTVTTAVLFAFPQTAKLSRGSSKWLQYGLFGLSIIFAMLTTISANYSWRSSAVAQASQASSSREEADGYKTAIDQLNSEIVASNNKIAKLEADQAKFDSLSGEFNAIERKIKPLKAEVEAKRAKIETLTPKKAQAAEAGSVSRDDLFTFMEKATGIKAESIEFSLGLIPALIADVAGPVAMRLFLFL